VNIFTITFFDEARSFIQSLPEIERAKVAAHIRKLAEDFDSVETKILRDNIKELKVKKNRLLFFIYKNTIYFVSGFIKKTKKTPLKEIEKAEKIYTTFIS
jgi:phage-related protein